jgi:hypothetical protein
MKKIILIIVAVLVVAGGVGYYVWTGTPIYSLIQLKGAIAVGDTNKALTYFDTDSIFETLWTEGMATVEAQVSQNSSTSLLGGRFAASLPQLTAVAKPLAKQKFVQILTASLASPKQKNPTATSTGLTGALEEKPTAKVSGGVATLTTPKGVTIVMKKQSDRSWKITEIKGVFEAALQNRQ